VRSVFTHRLVSRSLVTAAFAAALSLAAMSLAVMSPFQQDGAPAQNESQNFNPFQQDAAPVHIHAEANFINNFINF
jgi:hypothetical protein